MYNFEEKPISTLTSTPSLSFDDPKSILTYVLSPMGSNLGVLTSTMKSPWLLWQLLFDQQIAANNKKNIRSGILIGFLALGKTAKFSLQTLPTKSRSDLKNPNHFNFSSFFGDFSLKVFGNSYDRVIQISKEWSSNLD